MGQSSACSVMLVLAVSVLICSVHSNSDLVYKGGDGFSEYKDLIAHQFRDRGRRTAVIYKLSSATVDGMRASISLLRGTKKLPTSDKDLLKFQKSGSYDQTVTDFFSVRPKDVKEFYTPNSKGLFGYVGDRTILVQEMYKHTGTPILKIIRDLPSGGHHVQLISYIE